MVSKNKYCESDLLFIKVFFYITITYYDFLCLLVLHATQNKRGLLFETNRLIE